LGGSANKIRLLEILQEKYSRKFGEFRKSSKKQKIKKSEKSKLQPKRIRSFNHTRKPKN
jgi:hypothetical protein